MLNEQKATRKLMAIMSVDVKGYAMLSYTHMFDLSYRTDSQLRICDQSTQSLRYRKAKLKLRGL
jgi:hypothetical protein